VEVITRGITEIRRGRGPVSAVTGDGDRMATLRQPGAESIALAARRKKTPLLVLPDGRALCAVGYTRVKEVP